MNGCVVCETETVLYGGHMCMLTDTVCCMVAMSVC